MAKRKKYLHQLELRRVARFELLDGLGDEGLHSSRQASDVLRNILGDRPTESMVVLYLDSKRKPIGYEVVSVGDVSSAAIRVATVFRGALVAGAEAIIVSHNHPSGDPHPSTDDDAITKRMVEAGKLIQLQVVDHIIVADGRRTDVGPYYSYLDAGRLRYGVGR
ncbi:MAG: JAB domain-containing protein [Myxococcales bacterium]|nr:JAB domain-containing protein [Myxococcales bacterium]